MNLVAACIVALSILAGAFLIGGRYDAVAVSRGDGIGYVVVVDRFTGKKRFCTPAQCREIPDHREAQASTADEWADRALENSN